LEGRFIEMPIDAALVAQPIVALPSAKATARDAVRTLRCGEPALDACPGLISAAINTPMIGHNRGLASPSRVYLLELVTV